MLAPPPSINHAPHSTLRTPYTYITTHLTHILFYTTGGGIIGCTSAYFITRHPSFDQDLHAVTILEATGIASAASGKAGGLLALWAYPSNIVPLSYQLHAELAAEHNGAERWGYRKLHCGSLSAQGSRWLLAAIEVRNCLMTIGQNFLNRTKAPWPD